MVGARINIPASSQLPAGCNPGRHQLLFTLAVDLLLGEGNWESKDSLPSRTAAQVMWGRGFSRRTYMPPILSGDTICCSYKNAVTTWASQAFRCWEGIYFGISDSSSIFQSPFLDFWFTAFLNVLPIYLVQLIVILQMVQLMKRIKWWDNIMGRAEKKAVNDVLSHPTESLGRSSPLHGVQKVCSVDFLDLHRRYLLSLSALRLGLCEPCSK